MRSARGWRLPRRARRSAWSSTSWTSDRPPARPDAKRRTCRLILDVFTLFPEHFEWFLRQRHVSNALAEGNELTLRNYRDTTPLGAGQVDDSPYGGGAGMVMRVDVVDSALEAL